jgi:iron complex outermembrane receptor protein
MTKTSLNGAAAWVALAFCSTALPVQTANAQDAQADPAAANDTIEDIVVTAQKRETSLQDTPIAISAFTGETLEERGIDDIANLQSYVPNLRVGQEQDGFKISLRGIGLQGTSSITDSGVAFYLDNFYIPRPAGGSAVFYDVDRIEVLRGPQGTLYGRNATGGVVNVIARAPSDQFEGEVGASYGSRNLSEVRGVLNMPLAENVAARVSAVYTREDGYIENLSTNPGTDDFLGTDGDLTVRGQLAFGTPETLEVLLYGAYSNLNGTGVAMTYLERNNGGPPPTQALLATLPPEPADPLVTNNDQPGYNDSETTLSFARVTKSFGSVEAVLQAGMLWQTANVQQDFDGSPVNVSIFNKDQDNEAQSVEFRLSSVGETPLSWIVGAYYFSEDTYIFRRVRLNGLTPGGMISLPDFLLDEWGESSTTAAFGSLTYGLTDDFRLSAGVRYTEDEKSGRKVTRGNFGQPFPPDIPNAAFPGAAEFSETTWRTGLEWDPVEDVLVYATVSNGYKAGGFNLTSNGAPYEPETVMAYELGVKSDLLDRRARVNVDAFYYDYQDMQLTTLMTINNAPGQFTTNAAQSTIYGVEIDTQFLLGPNLSLTASYAYVNAEFEEYFNRDPRNPSAPLNPNDPAGLGRTDLSGNTVPYVAQNTLNLGLEYDADLGSAGSLTAAINANWHDELFLREYNDPSIDRVPPGTKTDITVTYNVGDSDLRITGYVTNLEDDVERNNIYISPGFVGESATTSYTRPRTVGVRVDYDF